MNLPACRILSLVILFSVLGLEGRSETIVRGNSGMGGAVAAPVAGSPEIVGLSVDGFDLWFGENINAEGALERATMDEQGVFSVSSPAPGDGASGESLYFVYLPVTADVQITARIESFSGDAGAFAGIMLRKTLATDSGYTFLGITEEAGPVFKTREHSRRSPVADWAFGGWVRIERSGEKVSGSVSTDGLAWTPLGTVTIDLGGEFFAGLAVGGADGLFPAEARFADVAVVALSGGPGKQKNPVASMVPATSEDADGDGLPDAWELTHFGNLSQNASGDPDGDGVSNLKESLRGSNPLMGSVAAKGRDTLLTVFNR